MAGIYWTLVCFAFVKGCLHGGGTRIFTLLVGFSCWYMHGMQEMWTDPRTPVLVSIRGLSLEPGEIELLQKYRPVDVILFGENCDNESQVIELTNHLKSLGFLVAIDIEGELVNRFSKFYPLKKNAVDFHDAPVEEIYDYYHTSASYAKKWE